MSITAARKKRGKTCCSKKFQGHVSRAYGLGLALALGHTCKVKPQPWYKGGGGGETFSEFPPPPPGVGGGGGGGGIRLLMVPLPPQGF